MSPDVVRTPRTGTTVTHRVLVLLGDGPAPGWDDIADPRSRAEPRVNAWIARLLGPPTSLVFGGEVRRGRHGPDDGLGHGHRARAVPARAGARRPTPVGRPPERARVAARAVLAAKVADAVEDDRLVLLGDPPADAGRGRLGPDGRPRRRRLARPPHRSDVRRPAAISARCSTTPRPAGSTSPRLPSVPTPPRPSSPPSTTRSPRPWTDPPTRSSTLSIAPPRPDSPTRCRGGRGRGPTPAPRRMTSPARHSRGHGQPSPRSVPGWRRRRRRSGPAQIRARRPRSNTTGNDSGRSSATASPPSPFPAGAAGCAGGLAGGPNRAARRGRPRPARVAPPGRRSSGPRSSTLSSLLTVAEATGRDVGLPHLDVAQLPHQPGQPGWRSRPGERPIGQGRNRRPRAGRPRSGAAGRRPGGRRVDRDDPGLGRDDGPLVPLRRPGRATAAGHRARGHRRPRRRQPGRSRSCSASPGRRSRSRGCGRSARASCPTWAAIFPRSTCPRTSPGTCRASTSSISPTAHGLPRSCPACSGRTDRCRRDRRSSAGAGSNRCRPPPDLEPGLQAQVADPLWLLARQWQFGELDGEDAGSPVEVATRRRRRRAEPLPGRPADAAAATGAVDLAEPAAPLEPLVEAEPLRAGSERLRNEAGLHFLRLLTRPNCPTPGALLTTRMPPASRSRHRRVPPARSAGGCSAAAFRTALASRPDSSRSPPRTARSAACPTAPPIPAADVDAVRTVAATLASLVARPGLRAGAAERRGTRRASSTRSPSRPISAAIRSCSPPTSTPVAGSTGSRSTCCRTRPSVAAAAARGGPRDHRCHPANPRVVSRHARRSAVAVRGCPRLPRPVDAGPTDLGRMLLVEFALAFGNDWFLTPVDLPAGSVFRLDRLVVRDTFGVETEVPPSLDIRRPALDDVLDRPGRRRPRRPRAVLPAADPRLDARERPDRGGRAVP